MRAAIYTRISNDREGAGLGVTRQEDDCRTLADKLGWDVDVVYSDNDISAYSGKPRPGYRALINALNTGTIDAVVAWHTDRLHRRVTDLEDLITICEARSVQVATVRAGDLDLSTPSGRMVARMLVAAAQHEVEHGRERIIAKKAQSAREGAYRGGPRPYGYESDGVTVREDEAHHVQRAAAAVLNGQSLRAVCRQLNDVGAVTSKGGEWKPHLLKAVLVRPRNAALIELEGVAPIVAQWPALLPEDTWRALVGLLTDPDRRTNAGRERRWLGSGAYLCGLCGDTMHVAMTAESRHYYTCNSSKHVTRDQGRLDEYISGVVVGRLRLPDLADLLPNAERHEEVAALSNEATVLRERQEQATNDYADGVITGPQLRVASERLSGRLAAVTARLSALHQGSLLGAVAAAQDPGAAFLASPLEVQAQILAGLMVVTVKPAPRGRPAGWVPGTPYFDPAYVDIAWR